MVFDFSEGLAGDVGPASRCLVVSFVSFWRWYDENGIDSGSLHFFDFVLYLTLFKGVVEGSAVASEEHDVVRRFGLKLRILAVI